MKKDLLKNILILDSIYQLIDWKDRVRIHFLLQEKAIETSPNIEILYNWMVKTKWIAPSLKYGQDRLQYFENYPDEWILIEEYKKHSNLELPCLTK